MKVFTKIAMLSGLTFVILAAYAATTPTVTTTSTTATTTTASTSKSNLVGEYKCNRTDAMGRTTQAPLSISGTGETYTLQWANPNGYPLMYGTGVMTKGMDNAMSVVFWDAKNTEVYGNELFVLKSDGSLSGTFVLQSDTKLGSETCTKG